MKSPDLHREIFKKGSKTYFNSSRFFPKNIRNDIYILYGFVRIADNFVDDIPQDAKGFYNFKNQYLSALNGTPSNDFVIDSFITLSKKHNFDPKWTEAFLKSMEMDLTKKNYDTIEETLEYIYGSAEVIGLFMAKIMNLPESAYPAALALGKSMQYINFIRDLAEDRVLGRRYLPIKNTEIEKLDWNIIEKYPVEFSNFIRQQTAYYAKWQKEAESGYKYIPKKYLIPIKTASDMYNWTAKTIEKDPNLVFSKKVKPPKALILWTAFKNRFYRPQK